MCARMDAIADGLGNRITETETRLRTHFDVVTESLRDDIRLIAEAVVALSERVDRTS